MKKLIPNIIDIICFVGGSMLLIYNLLDFKSGGGNIGYGARYSGDRSIDAYYYYYSSSNRILIAISLGLIVLGFLVRTWRKEKFI